MQSAYAVTQPRIHTWSVTVALVAAAQALPWIVHLLHLPGRVLLPMPFAAILAGLALGPIAGLLNGLAAPVLSFLVTGLPPATLVPLLAVEMAAYGGVAGYLAHRATWRGAWVVLPTVAAGRLAVLGAVAFLSPSVGTQQTSAVSFMWQALQTGWPGIALQVAALPFAVRWLAPAEGR